MEAPSGSLTKEERDRALVCLQETQKEFLTAISGLSEAQWKFKPGPDRWSIAECAEHVAVAEEVFWRLVERIMKEPATPEKAAEAKGKDEILLALGPERFMKQPAPEFVLPTGRWANAAEVTKAFEATRGQESAYLSETTDDLRNHFGQQPAAGTLDAYQFFIFNGVHCKRHIAQIAEIKADPNYPKS